MGAKTRRRFGHMFFPDPVPIRRTRRKRFRFRLRLFLVDDQEDEEYCGDDEREVCDHEIMPVHSGPSNWLEARDYLDTDDEHEPPRRKQKLELTKHEKEKAALLAQPDPWSPQAKDEEELEFIFAMASSVGEEECAPLPHLVESKREVKAIDRTFTLKSS